MGSLHSENQATPPTREAALGGMRVAVFAETREVLAVRWKHDSVTVLPSGDAKGGTNSSHVPHRSGLVLEVGGSGPFPRRGLPPRLGPVDREPSNVNW